jgi:hypothetical protein
LSLRAALPAVEGMMDIIRIDSSDIAELGTPVATYGAGEPTTDGTFELIVNIVLATGLTA